MNAVSGPVAQSGNQTFPDHRNQMNGEQHLPKFLRIHLQTKNELQSNARQGPSLITDHCQSIVGNVRSDQNGANEMSRHVRHRRREEASQLPL